MDFKAVDPNAVLDQIKEDRDLFEKALGKMYRVDNYDDRLPAGLSEFSKFFYACREVYARGNAPGALHQLFLDWLKENQAARKEPAVEESEAVQRIQALGFLMGEWDLDSTYSVEPDGPRGTDRGGRGTICTILDGAHLCFDYQGPDKETGEPSGSAHGVFAWDAQRQRYRYFWFESSGAFEQATAHLRDADTLFLDWDNDCIQTFQRVNDDTVVLEMTCPEQGLTLRVDMSRRAEHQPR